MFIRFPFDINMYKSIYINICINIIKLFYIKIFKVIIENLKWDFNFMKIKKKNNKQYKFCTKNKIIDKKNKYFYYKFQAIPIHL